MAAAGKALPRAAAVDPAQAGAAAHVRGWHGGRSDSWSGHYLAASALRSGQDAAEVIASPLTRRRAHAVLSDLDRALRPRLLPPTPAMVLEADEGRVLLEPLSPTIGVVIHGVDIAAPTPSQVALIWEQVLLRKVVFFKGQEHVSTEEQKTFAARFGECGLAYGEESEISEHDPAVTTTVDQQPPAPPPPSSDGDGLAAAGASASASAEHLVMVASPEDVYVPSTWHSDATFAPRPPMASLLLAREATPLGGDTLFVDTHAAWAGLSPTLRECLSELRAWHGRPDGPSEGDWKGGAVAKHRTVSRSELRSTREVTHPVCRTHPETQLPHLFVNPTFTLSICDMDEAESDALLSQLFTKMYSTPEYCCRYVSSAPAASS